MSSMTCVTAQLPAMRATAEMTLTETASIRRFTLTPDGMGGHTESWSEQGTAACSRSTQLSRSEMAVADKLGIAKPWTVRVPAGTDVTEQDRIVVDGDTLEVVHVSSRTLQITQSVLCKEVE